MVPIVQWLRIGSQMQEVWGSDPTGRVTGKSIPSLWRDKHPAINGVRPPEHYAGPSIRTNNTPPSQQNMKLVALHVKFACEAIGNFTSQDFYVCLRRLCAETTNPQISATPFGYFTGKTCQSPRFSATYFAKAVQKMQPSRLATFACEAVCVKMTTVFDSKQRFLNKSK